MALTADFVVVGGGVIGCAIAAELSSSGSVILVERGEVASEASSAAAGLLVPLHAAQGSTRTTLFDFYLESALLYPQLVAELEEEAGLQMEFEERGSYRIAVGDEEGKRLERDYRAWKAIEALRVEWLEPDDLRKMEPGFSQDLSGGVLSKDERSLNPGRLTHALAQRATRNGTRIQTSCPALGVRCSNGRFESVKIHGGEIAGGCLVLAAGAWTGKLGEWFETEIPIRPARGQMVALRGYTSAPGRSIFAYTGSVLPRLDGSVFVGATTEDVGFDRRNTPEGISRVLDMVPRLYPALLDSAIDRIWSGLRPRSSDDAPIIGPLPGYDNVCVASGHFKMGITAAPLTARIVRDHIVERVSNPYLDAFAPSRF